MTDLDIRVPIPDGHIVIPCDGCGHLRFTRPQNRGRIGDLCPLCEEAAQQADAIARRAAERQAARLARRRARAAEGRRLADERRRANDPDRPERLAEAIAAAGHTPHHLPDGRLYVRVDGRRVVIETQQDIRWLAIDHPTTRRTAA